MQPVWAVEVAPRISDREIIEALTEFKAGQQALKENMEERFKAVDQRFAAVDRQLDQIWGLQLVLIAGIFGLIGFVMWDRYSTLRPLDQRLRRIEEDLERDLELRSAEGSRLTRMIHALRELAKTDEKVAAVLRNFSLL